MWDILGKKSHTEEDVVRSQLLCCPEQVPAYVKRDILIKDCHVPERCEHCFGEWLEYDDKLDCSTCMNCGILSRLMGVADTAIENQFREGAVITKVHIYDRICHFKTLLNRITGEGSSKLCVTTLDIMRKMATSGCVVSPTWVSVQLKKQKKGNLLPHRFRIACIVSNGSYTPPLLELPQREQLLISFARVCECFDDWITKAVHEKRKNFLSYTYVALQLFDIHSYHHMKPHLTTISSKKLLDKHNMIWKIICERTGWKFNKI